jgi:Glycosyltransferase family 17
VRVFDTCIFGGDLDMLKVRLEELDDSPVSRHVISEARVTHQGAPKPVVVQDHIDCCLAPWKDRITLVIPEVPDGAPPWAVENVQREAIWAGLQDADPDDYVMLCDVDEIPSRSAMVLQPDGMVAFVQQWGLFAVDWLHPQPSATSVAGRRGMLSSLAAARLNDNRRGFTMIPGAGWHFTWLGGPGGIRRKVGQFCHTEITDFVTKANDAGELYEQGLGWDLVNPALARVPLIPADVDDTWPKAIYERRCPEGWFRP